MRRFFLENIDPNITTGVVLDVPEELIHRIKNVLRINEGDNLEFIDGKGLLLCVEAIGSGRLLSFKTIKVDKVKKDKPLIGLAVSMIRRERFDLLVEKAVELGVDIIIPLETEYSRPFSNESYSKLIERWQRIADQALSQCKRLFRCNVSNVVKIEELVNNKSFDEKIFFHFGKEKINSRIIKKDRSYLFIIGPEGGFSEQELDLLNKEKIDSYSLVDDILRTETAAFYVLSIFNFINSGL
ncbi:MAG: RsmE family RNA methyltransferase [bacterium]